ncbi:MAG: adenylate/guanylate cyclase domain-containing protein [Proteobacteria bacterium]|nr:adenylate/guanylate cyclase domain-containing protein [Pseudomonadota bacterium]
MSGRIQRRLTAILAADVVGYSRLMGEDDSGTLSALRQLRSDVFSPTVSSHNGTVVKSMGDGWLVAFDSAADAVNCAIKVQMALSNHALIRLRTGIHVGDVTHENEDVFGDGVNIAARLQEIAEPGAIVISDIVKRSVDGKLASVFKNLGFQKLKNIAEPVAAFGWGMTGVKVTPATRTPPDKPSIAVLPFDNMSDDPEQEFFADGIAEDVITALSRFRSLFVIARNSSFSYKGTSPDIRTVAGELGVKYVVEGSVRKAGNRVRITAQLIDATSGNHLWANRFDGSLDDVFELQDQITEQIVVAVEPEIEARERERARRKPPESLDAWELMQRGLAHFYRINKADRTEAIRLFSEAVALDPEFARAHAHLAYALLSLVTLGYAEDRAAAMASSRAAAERVVSLDPNEPLAHFTLGELHLFAGEIEMAIGKMQTAIAINPNSAQGYFGLGFAYHYGAGEAEQSLPHYDAALRLSPNDPMRWMTLMLKGSALRLLGRYAEAISHCRQACQFPDKGFLPYMHLTTALAEAGHISEAKAAVQMAMQLQPAFSIGFIRERFTGIHPTVLQSLLEGLRKAGAPEK